MSSEEKIRKLALEHAAAAIEALRALTEQTETHPEIARRAANTILQLAGLLPTRKPRAQKPTLPTVALTPVASTSPSMNASSGSKPRRRVLTAPNKSDSPADKNPASTSPPWSLHNALNTHSNSPRTHYDDE